MVATNNLEPQDHELYRDISIALPQWAAELGIQQIGITNSSVAQAGPRLQQWLKQGWHGSMDFMARTAAMRTNPQELLPGTQRIIVAKLNYLSQPLTLQRARLMDPTVGYISCYALGRDYHRLFRRKLQHLAEQISSLAENHGFRAYADSAPVMEKPLAQQAGLGWIGKNTNLISRQGGSWFFLGEIYTNLPLPINIPAAAHCGNCHACIDTCPTQALVAPYQLDARRCIAYLTIEEPASIPEALRAKMGNRIFGCDDCQHVCPWNHRATLTQEMAFTPRDIWQRITLIDAWEWSEAEFLIHSEGSPLRRIGFRRWLRNLAVALGNAPTTEKVIDSLSKRLTYPDVMVQEHVYWALHQHGR